MAPPLLLPKDLFNVEHRLAGGPNRDGKGFGPFGWDPAPNVPPVGALTFGNVIHTTETLGMPGYSGGVNPHLTYLLGGRWVQDLPFNVRAGTLKGTSTVENGRKVPTNRANVHQIEICAYSDWTQAAKYGGGRVAVRDLPDEDLDEIAKWIRWQYDEWGSGQPLVWYPYQRNSKGIMPHKDWVPLDGRRQWTVIDHWGAPDDSPHWDSDGLDRPGIMERVAALGALGPSQPPVEDPMGDWPNLLRRGDIHPAVRELRILFRRAGVLGPTVPWLEETFTSMVHYGAMRFQAKAGLIDLKRRDPSKDGVVGPKTRAALRKYL